MPQDVAAPALTPRRRELLEAAVHVVADEGLRGLTHRAVDRRAGLPEGSCSAYFRTRRALQVALAGHVARALAEDVSRLAGRLQGRSGADPQAVRLTARLFRRWLEERDLLTAKLELSLQASRDPELAELLAESRAGLVDVVAGVVDSRGRADAVVRAETLVASLDGVLVAALPRPEPDRRVFVQRSLEQLMAALAGRPRPATGSHRT